MTSNNKEVYLMRIPESIIQSKSLNGAVIDLRQSVGTVAKNAEETDPQFSHIYEVDRNQCQENLNLIKLNKMSETEFKADDSAKFCGYIRFRIKRNGSSYSQHFEPLPKRHVVEPIDNFIKSPSKHKSKASPKKKRKRNQ